MVEKKQKTAVNKKVRASRVKKTTTKEDEKENLEIKKESSNKKTDYIYAVGKRKTATAQLRFYPNGQGDIIVNGVSIEKYFANQSYLTIVSQPLKQLAIKDYHLTIIVRGGGKTGQAEAIRHALAKALIKYQADARPVIKARGWLKRDARIKERKKPGLKKARRAPQWSKR